GEFMPIQVFINNKGRGFQNATNQYFKEPLKGMWSKIEVGDFDEDGDLDFIVGNFGLNSQFKASKKEPITLVYDDFDGNGSIDPILCQYINGVSYPFMSRDELLDQMYGMRSQFTDYASFAEAEIKDIFSSEQLDKAAVLEVNELKSVYLENKGGQLEAHKLPIEAQYAPVYAITVLDHNDDGHLDFILAGNQNTTRLRLGVIDANFGQLYEGDGKGHFEFIPQSSSGLRLMGDIRSMDLIKLSYLEVLLIGINNQGVEAYLINRSMDNKPIKNLSEKDP
ncbi:MAG: VCBS repeat-containing protein, partial [Cyclobacteriaceae bacterium]